MIELIRGDSYTLKTTVYSDAAAQAALDLSSVSGARFTARRSLTGAIAITKELTTGVTIADSVNGKVDIAIVPADTRRLPAGCSLKYDLELSWVDGTVYTVDRGEIRILADVSL